MGAIEDLAAWLETGSTLLISGSNLFAHHLPERPEPMVLLSLEAGIVDIVYGSTLPPIATPTVIVTARSSAPASGPIPSPTNALRLSWNVYRKLSTLVDVTSTGSGRVFLAAVPVGEPGYAGQDEQGRSHFEQTYRLWHTPMASDYA